MYTSSPLFRRVGNCVAVKEEERKTKIFHCVSSPVLRDQREPDVSLEISTRRQAIAEMWTSNERARRPRYTRRQWKCYENIGYKPEKCVCLCRTYRSLSLLIMRRIIWTRNLIADLSFFRSIVREIMWVSWLQKVQRIFWRKLVVWREFVFRTCRMDER